MNRSWTILIGGKLIEKNELISGIDGWNDDYRTRIKGDTCLRTFTPFCDSFAHKCTTRLRIRIFNTPVWMT